MFPSIISLRMANLKKWTKLFTNLLALVLVYSVLIITLVTYIPLCISFVLREHYFAYISLLHHHAHTISPTSPQLHHHTFLIKLKSIQLHHLTFLIKFKSITLLHHNYFTYTKLITSPNLITLYTLIIYYIILAFHQPLQRPYIYRFHQTLKFHIQHSPLLHPCINISSLLS